MPRAIKIFCDASIKTGLGHLRRAQKLQVLLASMGFQARLFAPHPLADVSTEWLEESPLEWGDRVVVDSYLAPPSFYEDLAQYASTILVFEDMPHLYPQNIFVFNPAYQASTLYTHPTNPRYFLGVEFMPFERAFFAPTKVLNSPPRTLFLSFGGSNQALHFYTKALDILEKTPLSVHVIAPLEIVAILQKDYPVYSRRTYHADLPLTSIATQMHQSDLALLGAGGMLYEAISSLTPTISIPIASNQLPQLHALASCGACFAGSLDRLLDDLKTLTLPVRLGMQEAQKKLGIGAKLPKVLGSILNHV